MDIGPISRQAVSQDFYLIFSCNKLHTVPITKKVLTNVTLCRKISEKMELKNLLTAYCISLILTCLKYLRVWVQYRGDIRYEYSIPRCISQRGESGSAKSAGSQTPNSQSARLTPCCITERWVLFFANISAKKKIICKTSLGGFDS